jgi:crotonobetainyl-CoA:carnitine CoA-transferase CaiB-like acyl-CoA transferase
VTEPEGNVDPLADPVPNETYVCSDGRWVAVTAADDADWRALCAVMGRPDLAADGRLADQDGRRSHRIDVDSAVASWCVGRDAVTAMNMLQDGGVPAGVVQDASDLADDPQLAARGFWRKFEDHPHFGTRPFDRFPALWSTSTLEPYRRSPYFGEHNFEVYGDLAGYSVEEIAEGIGDDLFS